jgi:hypothetical protein
MGQCLRSGRPLIVVADRAVNPEPQPPDLVIVDEADRLKTASLEQLRDVFDRHHIGLVLIGMPGLQKRLARYAQLSSRVGFVRQFQPLNGRELQNVIESQWVQLGLNTAVQESASADVVRDRAWDGRQLPLVYRPFVEIERVLTVNGRRVDYDGPSRRCSREHGYRHNLTIRTVSNRLNSLTDGDRSKLQADTPVSIHVASIETSSRCIASAP